MGKYKKRQMSETLLLGMMLAVVGGFLDAYTYIIRGGVFANAQTGNIVLLGLHGAKGEWKEVIFYIIPIIAFALGVVMSEMVKSRFKMQKAIHWRQLVLMVEMILLLIVAFIPKGNMDVIVNIIVSFVCAMQVEAFRKVNGNAFATTMCTGNLRSGMEQLYHYKNKKDKELLYKGLQYYGVILFFIVGAVFGTVITSRIEEKSVLFCVAVLLAAFLLMFVREDREY